jgi:predicted CoA-substrate-specific enzyme activase
MSHPPQPLIAALDLGSTTIKGLVVREDGGELLFCDYRRHETRQLEAALQMLHRMESEAGLRAGTSRLFVTGSGAEPLCGLLGARFVQEVAALRLAIERRHPDAGSAVELGGQDAKILVFPPAAPGQSRRVMATMNDKCAGGTGAVIDRIAAKLHLDASQLQNLDCSGLTIHPVAGKCGVFAETDINGLQKRGLPPAELMASLFDAIVVQNLSVLTRGSTLLPRLLLLGGPNRFLPGVQQAWRRRVMAMWRERRTPLPEHATAEELIFAPEDAEFYAALGAMEFARGEEERDAGWYKGSAALEDELRRRQHRAVHATGTALWQTPEEIARFRARYTQPEFAPQAFPSGRRVEAFLGIDSGSTTTKAVLLAPSGEVLAKSYRLSEGNPLDDARLAIGALRQQIEENGARLAILGSAVTGYARQTLAPVLGADLSLVETIAHATAARSLFPDAEVVVDCGGQDIKLILLRDGRVRDFKLNTQCSAGNGYFLQSAAASLGVPVERFADTAFAARSMPSFNCGCAIFLQSDIVNFQRQGWGVSEILAGLAAVLPRNIFLHVAGTMNLAQLGSRFVLQGGTQRNLAVVKAEMDFLRERFAAHGVEPRIAVHPHCGEAGAIGAALEAIAQQDSRQRSHFIGLDAATRLSWRSTCDERTRCRFCSNRCPRTFLDVQTGAKTNPSTHEPPLLAGEVRLIVANCERGQFEDKEQMLAEQKRRKERIADVPDFSALAEEMAWQLRPVARVATPAISKVLPSRHRRQLLRRRESLRVALPRLFNLHQYAPLFTSWLQALGVRTENIIFSPPTSRQLYLDGAGRAAVDPCYPSKLAIPHVAALLRLKPDVIFLPMIDHLPQTPRGTSGSWACPTATMTPEAVKAAFTRERNLFAEAGTRYLNPVLTLDDEPLLCRQMWEAWRDLLGLNETECRRALDVAWEEQRSLEGELRNRARIELERLERENRLGIVLLGRIYHHDPGIGQQIAAEFQRLGYPVFSQSFLPTGDDDPRRLFAGEIREGRDPLSLAELGPGCFSASTNQKLWAARFAARHPNLVALELSNFKCGHDAAISHTLQQIVERSGTPFFSFRELDENRPSGAIQIRVETMHHFLQLHRRQLFGARESAEEEPVALAQD